MVVHTLNTDENGWIMDKCIYNISGYREIDTRDVTSTNDEEPRTKAHKDVVRF